MMTGAEGVELALGIAFGGVELVVGGENIACTSGASVRAGSAKTMVPPASKKMVVGATSDKNVTRWELEE
jgi:hypothetical protein